MIICTINDIKQLIHTYSVSGLIDLIHTRLTQDFSQREEFRHSPRYAHYVDQGAIELMPTGNQEYFAYKYVNGHPGNVSKGFPSIMGIGQLSKCNTGVPILISEMTILTALRTAATTQLAASYGSLKHSSHLCIIGNGSQSVFQTIAICDMRTITHITHYDPDPAAMQTFATHMHDMYPHINIQGCEDTHTAARDADIIITVTEQFGCHKLITLDDIKPGAFIAAVGGDCPDKTEVDPNILLHKDTKILVEYEPQTRIEGELQHCPDLSVDAHIHELVTGKKEIRSKSSDIVIFDSVGFALEDYAALHVIYNLLTIQDIYTDIPLLPTDMTNIKDIYGYSQTRHG